MEWLLECLLEWVALWLAQVCIVQAEIEAARSAAGIVAVSALIALIGIAAAVIFSMDD